MTGLDAWSLDARRVAVLLTTPACVTVAARIEMLAMLTTTGPHPLRIAANRSSEFRISLWRRSRIALHEEVDDGSAEEREQPNDQKLPQFLAMSVGGA